MLETSLNYRLKRFAKFVRCIDSILAGIRLVEQHSEIEKKRKQGTFTLCIAPAILRTMRASSRDEISDGAKDRTNDYHVWILIRRTRVRTCV